MTNKDLTLGEPDFDIFGPRGAHPPAGGVPAGFRRGAELSKISELRFGEIGSWLFLPKALLGGAGGALSNKASSKKSDDSISRNGTFKMRHLNPGFQMVQAGTL